MSIKDIVVKPGIRVCILVKNEDIEAARDIANKNFDYKLPLNIKVSNTGLAPATHFFCTMNLSEELYNKLLTLQDKSDIECCDPKEFLFKRNLLIIKNNSSFMLKK